MQTKSVPRLCCTLREVGSCLIEQCLLSRWQYFAKNVKHLTVATHFPDGQINIDKEGSIDMVRNVDVAKLAVLRKMVNKISTSRR